MSVAYWSTCRPTIRQPLSVDISTDISIECQSTYRLICRPIYQVTHLGRHIDRYVDRHIGWHSADVSTDTSVDCRSICRSICRSRGAQNTHDPGFIWNKQGAVAPKQTWGQSIDKVWQKSQCRFYFSGMTLIWQGGWRYWGGTPKIFRHPKGGLWKSCWARRGGSENLYSSKPTHDIIIQIGWFSA